MVSFLVDASELGWGALGFKAIAPGSFCVFISG